MLLLIVVILVVAASICALFASFLTVWSSKNVKQKSIPSILSETCFAVFKRKFMGEILQDNYTFAHDSRYLGIYQFFKPVLLILDPDLIKEMIVKNFDYFPNHMQLLPESASTLWNKSLVSLVNQEWKEMRSTLSPVFTGSKMKLLYSSMSESSEEFVNNFLHQDTKIVSLEGKDAFTRFTNDVIVNTIFGIKCNSLKQKQNHFYLMGREAAALLWDHIYAGVFYMLPNAMKTIGITIFSKNFSNFFRRVVKDTIEERKNMANLRPDMIDLLTKALQNAKNTTITNEDVTAQTMLFYFAGLESVSSLLCFMSHELAVNPQIQEKLYTNIKIVLEKFGGEVCYESVSQMKYLDMVISETLRKWPNIIGIDRQCAQDFTLQPKSPEEKPLILKKDTIIIVPIFAIHRDPKHFPNPDLFDPERFSAENKNNINPYTYMPFGVGPRVCIGARYTIQVAKILFCHILPHFEIVPIEKTQVPLQLDKSKLFLSAEKGFWLGLKKRDS